MRSHWLVVPLRGAWATRQLRVLLVSAMWSQLVEKEKQRHKNDKAKRHKNNDSKRLRALFLCHLRWGQRGREVLVGRQPCLSKGQGWGRSMDLQRWGQPQWRSGETKALLFPQGNIWPRPWVGHLVCSGLLTWKKSCVTAASAVPGSPLIYTWGADP